MWTIFLLLTFFHIKSILLVTLENCNTLTHYVHKNSHDNICSLVYTSCKISHSGSDPIIAHLIKYNKQYMIGILWITAILVLFEIILILWNITFKCEIKFWVVDFTIMLAEMQGDMYFSLLSVWIWIFN